MALRDLSSQAAVLQAMREYDRVGQDAFLEKYGFDRAYRFVAVREGRQYDSKAILSAAHGYQYPQEGPLTPHDFSGGRETLRQLERLDIETRRIDGGDPEIGDAGEKQALVDRFGGGNYVSGIMRFTDDHVTNVWSDDAGPYPDERIEGAAILAYCGQGLRGHQRPDRGGNALLEADRLAGRAVRYWHKPRHGEYAFECWAVVIGRRSEWGVGQDDERRIQLRWLLAPVDDRDPNTWPVEIRHLLQAPVVDDALDAIAATTGTPAQRRTRTYRDLCASVETNKRGPRSPVSRSVRAWARSATARDAVLLRADGACENPGCTGMPSDVDRRGEPILEVDHVSGVAVRDEPEDMVALCPNCHAMKTRGRRWRQLTRLLRGVARERHAAAL